MTAQFRVLSPLAAVPPSGPVGPDLELLTTWADEPERFLIAWRLPETRNSRSETRFGCTVEALGCEIEVTRAELVPVQLPHFEGNTTGFIADAPTLLPDPLLPVTSGRDSVEATLCATHLGWHCLHVVLRPEHDTTVRVSARLVGEWDGATTPLGHVEIPLRRAASKISRPDGPWFSQWMHPDCLLHTHDVTAFSEEHWEVIAAHLGSAAAMGATGTIAPLWNPALDTAAGTYRPDVQLLDIERTATGHYTFRADRARRFLRLMVEAGMRHVETPPLFTQWGAEHAPPIRVVTAAGEPELLFGWHTAADDEEYLAFLDELLPFVRELLGEFPELTPFVHISDEPHAATAQRFTAVRARLARGLGDLPTLDALSDPDFQDLVDVPVVATDAVQRWRDAGVEPRWVYHCVIQADLANRFIAMDPVRIRMIGAQMFATGATGFLHWGFDFYFHALSRGRLDPWRDTSAGGCFPSGDAFVVYPGPDLNPVRSLRWWQLRDAFRDWALFTHAAETLGRDHVLDLLDEGEDLDYDVLLDAATYARRRGNVIGRLGLEERIPENLLLSRARVAADPAPETLRRLSLDLHEAAQLALVQERWEVAEALYREGLTHLHALWSGEDPALRQLLLIALETLGDLAEKREDWDLAAGYYAERLDLERRVAADSPDAEALHDLQLALDDVGDVAVSRGDLASAVAHYGESVAIAREQLRSDSDPQARVNLAVGLRNLSHATGQLGLGDEARRLAAEAREIAAPLNRPDLLAWIEELLE